MERWHRAFSHVLDHAIERHGQPNERENGPETRGDDVLHEGGRC